MQALCRASDRFGSLLIRRQFAEHGDHIRQICWSDLCCFENSAPTLPLCDRLLRLRRLLLGLNGDDIAQTLQPALEVGSGAGLVELVKIRLAELAIADAAAEHVIGRH